MNELKERYIESLKHYRDLKNVVDTSREEGWVEGLEVGREEGKVEGRVEGREVGREERNFEIAGQMKKEGFTNEQIKKITGLTDDDIGKL